MNTNEHIVSSFDRDLESIQAGIMKMGGLVEDSIHKSVLALDTRDPELADLVRAGDAAIDALETQVNEEAARILALRSPTASDLRTVLSVFRVSTNLERIGDYSKNIAKRSHAVMAQPPIEGATASLRRMAREVELMLKDVLDAYIQRDLGLAEDVRERDLEIDQIYSALFREYLTFMMEDPRSITACMHLHFMAKNIERMGDHVTSIAEQVVYLVTGAMPEDIRPKQDVISEASNKL
ncbi:MULTISPECIES: phosphate signaling complex protein PhoU [unclassified Roseobacter]|jgi:phosphate transport system protein|uniref:phosphate signaling complex protein PhoU n=1 Tax=unclassified Roseobacter TaxID=196798 RepID=UPI00237220E8|nr:phosphate signaling complex protein PhoU [Rhodobacterales bacterium FZCC0069]MBF9027987.1 phosphate signaling complex protein PhoU [Rhodobacterales bacterium FZCC0188]MDB2548730.1 phosphate signaling complex protein PhoU [Paracoccaceae bacterium]